MLTKLKRRKLSFSKVNLVQAKKDGQKIKRPGYPSPRSQAYSEHLPSSRPPSFLIDPFSLMLTSLPLLTIAPLNLLVLILSVCLFYCVNIVLGNVAEPASVHDCFAEDSTGRCPH
jgi:hypothetical protein